MKKLVTFPLALLLFLSSTVIIISAEEINISNGLVDYSNIVQQEDPNASGLILSYTLNIARQGNTTLIITGDTDCNTSVVRCGFKSLIVERRLNSSTSWSEYYNYGNVYVDKNNAHFYDELSVDPGYQYRVTCKHYAKKNFLNTQSISNTSNIVTF